MSILIKGAKMPSNCVDCCAMKESGIDEYCSWKYRHVEHDAIKCRPSWCPLVEIPPHGRLIDADALKDKLSDKMETDKDLFMFLVTTDHMPTVIESEEQEHE